MFHRLLLIVSLATISNAAATSRNGNTQEAELYDVGVGIGDVTGPSAGLGLMGYANLAQTAKGIHTRLFARTFIVKSGESRVVFVSADIGMIDTAIKREVVTQLENEFGGIYNIKNVLLSGTHTHSGPGGYMQYAMYGISSLGFHKQSFNAIIDGIMLSIRRAHYTMQPGRLNLNFGELFDASINRSPAAYKANTPLERAKYPYDVDKEMTLIRIDAADGRPLGTFNWFAVHPTSMNNQNKLISGDNKGYASMLFEYEMNPNDRPGKGKFVAGFASSNLGDVSPNTDGPKCRRGLFIGKPCDELTSTCGDNAVQNCYAVGPGANGDMEESTEIIGRRQFDKAWELFNASQTDFVAIVGKVQHSHQNVDMTNYAVSIVNSEGIVETKYTCPAAMGYSFAGGTIDGPGMFDFKQGMRNGNEFWDSVRDFLKKPSEYLEMCHGEKPILLAIGEANVPYDWAPSIIETQVLRIGNLFIVGIPGELTTMAGRRLREKIRDKVIELEGGDIEPRVVIAGLSNVYTHYITTIEEYNIQRYEGASTIFGPYTLDAYLQQYPKLVQSMLKDEVLEGGPETPNLMSKQLSFLLPIIVDLPPAGYSIGSTKLEPLALINAGETVKTVFVSGHLRHDTMREGSFFIVERLQDNGTGWEVVANDADWSTKIIWKRPIPIFGLDSEVEISWKTTSTTPLGVYRIRHFGFYKPYMEELRKYQATSRTFEIQKSGSIKRKSGQIIEREESTLIKFWKQLTNSVFQKSE